MHQQETLSCFSQLSSLALSGATCLPPDIDAIVQMLVKSVPNVSICLIRLQMQRVPMCLFQNVALLHLQPQMCLCCRS